MDYFFLSDRNLGYSQHLISLLKGALKCGHPCICFFVHICKYPFEIRDLEMALLGHRINSVLKC